MNVFSQCFCLKAKKKASESSAHVIHVPMCSQSVRLSTSEACFQTWIHLFTASKEILGKRIFLRCSKRDLE